jgi:hydrogenase maturation protein HypF
MSEQLTENAEVICQRIRLSGVVQGVGFRPLVWRLAHELKLSGWVRNDAQGVEIEVCGPREAVELLLKRLHQDAPPLARIDAITSRFTDSVAVSDDFYILDSRGGRAATMIGQDTAICRNCLGEMFAPNGRRWRYAFTNCAHCGPRYTICHGLPYDRERTSMKPFAMCKKCQAEYRKPDDRRLHAEGNCCPKCGPQISLLDAHGEPIAGDVVANAYALLQAGKILAIKGPGGFHLACDAKNTEAVALLRQRKNRRHKPFSVMFANALSATTYVQVSVGEPGLLNLPERPVILLRKRSSCDRDMANVAPGLPWLGVMLPVSPLHYLLFHEAAGRPAGTEWLDKAQPFALLMTSGNPSREPPATDNIEALQRLSGIADAFLVHNRDVVAGCDDSIALSGLGGLQIIRRSRGYTPRSIKLPHPGPPILAVGGQMKNAVCVTRGQEAFVSQHIGELSNTAACAFFEETIFHLLKVLEVSPTLVAHDLNKDSHARRFAAEMARQRDIPMLGVHHHHAHIAAVLAEHHINTPIFALALDGGEIAADGTIWGGELLKVDGAHFDRLGQIVPMRIPGDEDESRVPWRLAGCILHALGRTDEIAARFPDQPMAPVLADQLANGRDWRHASSLGRLLDGVASLLGINHVTQFRGQTGILLEGKADHFGETPPLADGWRIRDGMLDLLPLLSALADEKHPERGAALFHSTLIAALTDWLCSVAPEGSTVAAGGGCLQNQVLVRGLHNSLSARGLHLVESRRLPPSDGGLALGQAWVAQQYLLGV